MHLSEIPITAIDGIRIGNAQDYTGMTGVTVVLFDTHNAGGIDISGGGAAGREAALIMPLSHEHSLNALVFSGGSAFGLDAATGVMRYCEEHGMGYRIGNACVPLVCQSCIFDLHIGNAAIRPDAQMGYDACIAAEKNCPGAGIVGAGTGATIGKLNGIRCGQKSGMQYYAVQCGALKIGALAVVNAFGDVFDFHTGKKIGGTLNTARTAFIDTADALSNARKERGAHTTLAAIFTNAAFNQVEMNKIAAMARAALGRCINPVGTNADGDTIYAFSVGKTTTANIDYVGTLAATVLSEAIVRAVQTSHMDDAAFLPLLASV
ncbi:MAG: P1 family peptidase [Treponema sp.]|nr:P1 family peptidase [Treponema sp.]